MNQSRPIVFWDKRLSTLAVTRTSIPTQLRTIARPESAEIGGVCHRLQNSQGPNRAVRCLKSRHRRRAVTLSRSRISHDQARLRAVAVL
jgi:hypothetical protein